MASSSKEASRSETPPPERAEVEQSPFKSSDSTEGEKILQSKPELEQFVDPKEVPTQLEGQGGPSSPSGDLKTGTDLTERGKKAYEDKNFTEAADFFRRALAIRVKHYGEFSPQCAWDYVYYGLALLSEVAIPIGDDQMAVVPKEADHQHCFDKDGSITAAKQDGNQIHSDRDPDGSITAAKQDGNQIHSDRDPDGGVKLEGRSKTLKSAWNQLTITWSILNKQPGALKLKAHVLNAVGNVAIRTEELSYQDYYLEAMLENMVEPEFQCTSNLFSKISLFLERCSKTEAISYCEKAVSVCQTRLEQLLDELKRPLALANAILNEKSSSLPPSLYDSILKKKAEIDTLIEFANNFAKKIEDMRNSLASTSTPDSSANLERTSTDATTTHTSSEIAERTSTDASKTPISSENTERTTAEATSSQMSATKHWEFSGIASLNVSTAHIDMTGSVKQGSGAKIQSSTEPASAESTSTKKPSSESPIEKGDRSAS